MISIISFVISVAQNLNIYSKWKKLNIRMQLKFQYFAPNISSLSPGLHTLFNSVLCKYQNLKHLLTVLNKLRNVNTNIKRFLNKFTFEKFTFKMMIFNYSFLQIRYFLKQVQKYRHFEIELLFPLQSRIWVVVKLPTFLCFCQHTLVKLEKHSNRTNIYYLN